jgi:hypothetical protein
MQRIALAALVAMNGGCANVDYASVEKGSFEGEVAVVWLRGTEGPGDGTFVYVPTPRKPLTFTRPEGKTAGAVIVPTMIYTDGGSIPSVGRLFNGLTPWNYGPAYIVHDWLFRAKQCLNANSPNPDYAVVRNLTFQDSAEIIAESIKALQEEGRVRKDDVSAAVVTAGVTSPITRSYWNQKGPCKEVSAADSRLALEAVGRGPRTGDEGRARILREDGATTVSEPAAVVVAVTSF